MKAHRNYDTGKWCTGGEKPIARNREPERRSVRTVSGGLPGLGKRR